MDRDCGGKEMKGSLLVFVLAAAVMCPAAWGKADSTPSTSREAGSRSIRFRWSRPDRGLVSSYLFAMSFDGGRTWKTYSTADTTWAGPAPPCSSTVVARVAAVNYAGIAGPFSRPSKPVVLDFNSPPSAFRLLGPEQGSVTGSTRPTFTWEPASDDGKGKIRYEILISETGGFDLPEQVFSVEDTFWTPALEFAENQVCYWTVQAVDQCGACSRPAEGPHHFFVDALAEPPEAPSINAPSGRLPGLGDTLRWSIPLDPDPLDSVEGYFLRVGFDSAMTSVAAEETLFGRNWFPVAELRFKEPVGKDVLLYWDVAAFDHTRLASDFSALPGKLRMDETNLTIQGLSASVLPSGVVISFGCRAGEPTHLLYLLRQERGNEGMQIVSRKALLSGGRVSFTDTTAKAGHTYLYHLAARDAAGRSTILGSVTVRVHHAGTQGLVLYNTQPNPFRNSTSIGFEVPERTPVRLSVFGVNGRRIRTIVAEPLIKGFHLYAWDGRDDTGRRVASGVYLLRLQTSSESVTRKMLIVR